MSLELLRSLRGLWHKDDDFRSVVNKSLDEIGFTDSYVQTVVAGSGHAQRKAKQLKDNVWGMMEFDWRSMRLIDSPIIQRLRHVHQLGLSYLTYPTAEHSRFSHTLGVAHVVNRFVEAIDKRATEPTAGDLRYVKLEDLDGIKRYHMTHAALLHDVGHLPYSHVSEKVLTSSPDSFRFGKKTVTDLLFDANAVLRKDVPLAELLSLVVVLSPRFEQFYREAILHGEPDTDDGVLILGCLIVGLAPKPSFSALSDLISSASVDADKVDYVNRDAMNCGIPIGVDVSRVFLRSGIVSATAEQMKLLGLKEIESDEFILVINSSGMDTIDEVLMARTALYQRVYFHAVTRTAERIFGASLLNNANSATPDNTLIDVMDLWAKDDASALRSLLQSPDIKTAQHAKRIQLRQLPKKAYAFGPSLGNLSFPIEEILRDIDDQSWNEIRKLANTIVEEQLRDERLWDGQATSIEAKIVERAAEIAQSLTAAGQGSMVPTTPNADVLLVGTAHKDKRRHVPIMCQGDQLIAGREYTNAAEQQDAFELLKEVGFAMSDPDWRLLNFFAARDVLSTLSATTREIEIKVGGETYTSTFLTRFLPDYRSASVRSSQPAKRLVTFERAVRQTTIFEEKPWLAEPVSPDNANIRKVATKLKAFQGVHGWQVTPRTASYFASQFPPSLRDELLEILENQLLVIDWNAIHAALAPIVSKSKSADVVGFTPTSGAIVQNRLKRELKNSEARFPSSLDDALDNDNTGSLIFVDDNTSSGVQATSQILQLFSVPREEWPEDCRNEENLLPALSQERLGQLKTREISLVFCVGTDAARQKVQRSLEAAGIMTKVDVHYAAPLRSVEKLSSPMTEFLSEVGTEVVAWSRFRKQASELSTGEQTSCQQDALGYGNAGGLVTTLQSVPTGTITAFWQPGLFRGQPWMPLLIRDSRFRDLVIG